MQHTLVTLTLIILLAFGGAAQPINRQQKQAIITQAKELLVKNYHFQKQVKPMTDLLDRQWTSGRYDTFTRVTTFTAALSRDLKGVAHDQHLNFFYLPASLVDNGSGPGMPWGLVNEKFLNNGLTGIEILPGDIGYMHLQAFGAIEDLLPAAFTFLANTRALIIDLRGNGGGMPSFFVSSYLLPEDSIHLVTIYWNDHTDQFYTQRLLRGPRYLDRPVYLLTDKGTFSSAEEFAYDLQQLKRVTIVGEATGGGANPGAAMPVYTFPDSSRLDLFVPLAHVEHAISKGNWEGVGVQPDVPVKGSDALAKAHLLALNYLIEKEQTPLIKKQYREIKKKLQATSYKLQARSLGQ